MLTAGIDVSKATLDVAIHGQKAITYLPNTPAGWTPLAGQLAQAGVGRVGLEATGGYERGVMAHLRAQGLAVTQLQPVQVKAFGMLHLRRAKTDRIDAALIAACTHVLGDPDKMAPDARLEALADHLTLIEQVEEHIARFKTWPFRGCVSVTDPKGGGSGAAGYKPALGGRVHCVSHLEKFDVA